MRRNCEQSGLAFEWRIPVPLASLLTDRLKLKIVLKNLVDNAIKFTREGKVSVVAEARAGGVEFCVSDTGIGIGPEVMPHIFELFRQGDRTMTRRYGGVGLGLYLVRRMLELLGGK
jgi:signal transduction histidine kinase